MEKQELVRKTTLKIFEVILEEMNGYTKEEIKSKKLAEDCYGSNEFERIETIIKSVIK